MKEWKDRLRGWARRPRQQSEERPLYTGEEPDALLTYLRTYEQALTDAGIEDPAKYFPPDLDALLIANYGTASRMPSPDSQPLALPDDIQSIVDLAYRTPPNPEKKEVFSAILFPNKAILLSQPGGWSEDRGERTFGVGIDTYSGLTTLHMKSSLGDVFAVPHPYHPSKITRGLKEIISRKENLRALTIEADNVTYPLLLHEAPRVAPQIT